MIVVSSRPCLAAACRLVSEVLSERSLTKRFHKQCVVKGGSILHVRCGRSGWEAISPFVSVCLCLCVSLCGCVSVYVVSLCVYVGVSRLLIHGTAVGCR